MIEFLDLLISVVNSDSFSFIHCMQIKPLLITILRYFYVVKVHFIWLWEYRFDSVFFAALIFSCELKTARVTQTCPNAVTSRPFFKCDKV